MKPGMGWRGKKRVEVCHSMGLDAASHKFSSATSQIHVHHYGTQVDRLNTTAPWTSIS